MELMMPDPDDLCLRCGHKNREHCNCEKKKCERRNCTMHGCNCKHFVGATTIDEMLLLELRREIP